MRRSLRGVIRLWRAKLIVGDVGYNCTDVSIWFGARSVLRCRVGSREKRWCSRTGEGGRLHSEVTAFRRVGTIDAVVGTRHGSRKMYTLRHIGMAVRE